MALGFRTTVLQLGEIPAIFPNQLNTNVAVKKPIAARGSKIHLQTTAMVSLHFSRSTRGVLAMMRVGSHAGGSCTGKALPHSSTLPMLARSSLQAIHDCRCAFMR